MDNIATGSLDASSKILLLWRYASIILTTGTSNSGLIIEVMDKNRELFHTLQIMLNNSKITIHIYHLPYQACLWFTEFIQSIFAYTVNRSAKVNPRSV